MYPFYLQCNENTSFSPDSCPTPEKNETETTSSINFLAQVNEYSHQVGYVWKRTKSPQEVQSPSLLPTRILQSAHVSLPRKSTTTKNKRWSRIFEVRSTDPPLSGICIKNEFVWYLDFTLLKELKRLIVDTQGVEKPWMYSLEEGYSPKVTVGQITEEFLKGYQFLYKNIKKSLKDMVKIPIGSTL